jgi:membrane-bound lytic murein transglycosylase MltF
MMKLAVSLAVLTRYVEGEGPKRARPVSLPRESGVRWWRLFVVATLALLALGCEAVDPPETVVLPVADELPQLESPRFELPDRWLGDLDGMHERRMIRVGTTFSLTHYFLDGATQRGLVYEAMREFEAHVNRELGTPRALQVRIVFVPMRRDRLLPALVDGHIDIAIANLTVTPERLESVAFSMPLARNVSEVLVTGPGSPAISSLDDLAGQIMHLRRSSSYWESIEALNASFRERGLEAVRLVEADEHLEDEDLLEMVAVGILPYMIVDDHKARFWAEVFDGLVMHPELAVRTGGQIAWALRQDTPELMAMVNGFVGQIRRGTLTGNVLLRRYLQDNRWVRNPAATADRRRFEETADLFEEYADQYDFDWLMLTALAYQESRIDQSARSPAGALGIMQLLPTTAADRAVGIPDISTPRNNIHAGARYLRWLADVHLRDPAIDDVNRTLFAFAAYNAGPGNLNRIRQRTMEMGLDPNVWFGNAELGAAQIIGRETVTYVTNISKYYFAFQLITAEMEARERAREMLKTP